MADVLIVDDSLTVRMDLKQAIEAEAHSTVLCENLAAAKRELAGGSFRVILLDVMLPDGDGVDFLFELRSKPETMTVAVMLLSSQAEVADRIGLMPHRTNLARG